MTLEERKKLKEKYLQYKAVYHGLKNEALMTKDLEKRHEIILEMQMLGWQISRIRSQLYFEPLKKLNLSEILDNYIFEEKTELGGR